MDFKNDLTLVQELSASNLSDAGAIRSSDIDFGKLIAKANKEGRTAQVLQLPLGQPARAPSPSHLS